MLHTTSLKHGQFSLGACTITTQGKAVVHVDRREALAFGCPLSTFHREIASSAKASVVIVRRDHVCAASASGSGSWCAGWAGGV
jgi:hypothetical protein